MCTQPPSFSIGYLHTGQGFVCTMTRASSLKVTRLLIPKNLKHAITTWRNIIFSAIGETDLLDYKLRFLGQIGYCISAYHLC